MSNLQTYYHFKLNFQKVDQHTGGKWLMNGTKHRKDNQLQTLWRHQMETFSGLLALCAEIHWWLVNSPHKGQWRGALMFSLICAWINNHEACYLRRHRAHYDVIVMKAWNFPVEYLSRECIINVNMT